MKGKAGPSSKELLTVADAEKFLANSEHSIVGLWLLTYLFTRCNYLFSFFVLSNLSAFPISKVTTLWRCTNVFIIIIIVIMLGLLLVSRIEQKSTFGSNWRRFCRQDVCTVIA